MACVHPNPNPSLSMNRILRTRPATAALRGTLALSTLAAIGALSACGGGSDAAPSGTTSTVSGTAAVGAPIVGGTVTAKCAAGTSSTATTGTDGRFDLALTNATQPCLLEVSGGTVNGRTNTDRFHSASLAAGTVNVTNLTELMVAHALQATASATTTTQYAGALPTARLTGTTLSASKAYVLTLLPQLGAATPASGVDIVTSAFAADGTGLDAVLDDLAAALRGKTLAAVGTAIGTDAASTTAPGNPAAALTTVAQKVLKVKFAAVAGSGNTPVSCGSQVIGGLGTSSASAKLQDLRFYLSGAQLLDAGGNVVSTTIKLPLNTQWNYTSPLNANDWTTLIDLENGTGACASAADGTTTAAMNDTLRLVIPSGVSFSGIQLVMGLPDSLNKTSATAPAPLDAAALAWGWAGGAYKFAKIELVDANKGTATAWPAPATGTYDAFYFHLGATGCTADPISGINTCTRPNRMAISLASFNPATQQVAVDLAALVASNDIQVNLGGAPGCMSGATDGECIAQFPNALGLDVSTGRPVTGGAAQTVFRAISR